MKDMLAFADWLYHSCRLFMYELALNHVGHAHPDAALLTLRAAESRAVFREHHLFRS